MTVNKKDIIKTLGLSAREGRILDFLAGIERSNVSQLAKTLSLPRTTVSFLLKRLLKRGLARRVRVGNHQEWQTTPKDEVIKKLENLLAGFERSSELLGRVETPVLGMEIFRGKKKIKDCYRKIFEAGKNNRVYVIQGNRSAELVLKKIEKEYFFDFHKKFKKFNIIMEGVMGERALGLFETLSVEELYSHFGRMVIAYIAPDAYVDFAIDIIIFGNIAILVDVEEENVMIVRNVSIVSALKSFFQILQENSKKIDLNAYIKNMIAKKMTQNEK